MIELALHHPHNPGQWALTVIIAVVVIAAGVWLGRHLP
jgi:hypothetical protein